MYMVKKEDLPPCPVATTVQLIGSKWKLLIMRDLLKRPWRFNELKKDLEGISQKVLTSSLRSMEEDGIVVRTVYPEVPPRVEYSLSELGNPCVRSWMPWNSGEWNIRKICRYKKSVPQLLLSQQTELIFYVVLNSDQSSTIGTGVSSHASRSLI